MPHPNRQVDMYQNMEKFGILYALGAFKDDELAGFALLTVTVVPHYGVKVGSTESIFVAVEHRKGGPGLRLLREAECWAKELGAVGMLVSSPYGARLAEVLPRAGYKPSNQVFFKGLS
jgi:GNAT superfamily N-acetyltransferase